MTSSSKRLRRGAEVVRAPEGDFHERPGCDVRRSVRSPLEHRQPHRGRRAPRNEVTGGRGHGLRPEHPLALEIDAVSALRIEKWVSAAKPGRPRPSCPRRSEPDLPAVPRAVRAGARPS
jgi:hypothetical protein